MQAIGLKTHIWNNAAKSLLLLLGFPFLILIVCYAFALLYVGFFENPDVLYGLQRGLELLPAVLPIALIFSGLWLLVAFFAHQWMIDKLTGASKIDRKSEPRLYNMVENLAIQRGLPTPSIRIIETSQLNAYASGVRREHYAVTVTRGLLDELDDAELEAVLAHEMTHIINGDVRLIVIAAVFAGLVSLVGDVMIRGFGRGAGFRSSGSSSSGSSSKSKGGGGGGAILIIIAIFIFILARLAALALRMAISRRREFMADAGAVELTKDPDAMIGALRKIEHRSNLGTIPGQVEALFIDSDSSGFWATHPSIGERCEALVRYAGGRDPGPRLVEEAPPGQDERLEPQGQPSPLPEPLPSTSPAGGPWSR
jgi:heat shock protein HtpX